MMRLFRMLALTVPMLVLSACGGGSECDAGTPTPGGGSSCETAAETAEPTGPTAQKLVLVLDRTQIDNTGSETVTATATATAASGETVADVAVQFTVDGDANFTPASSTTNALGSLEATVSIGSNRSNRVIKVVAASGDLSTSASFSVTGAKLTGTPVPAVVLPLSSGNKIDFRLTDANANPMPGAEITIAVGLNVVVLNALTGPNGDYSYVYTAPATGPLNVVATAGGVSTTATVLVQSPVGAIPPVTDPILSASVSVNPTVVLTNEPGSTTNQAQVRALFLGAGNKPIENVRVKFDTADDPLFIGGSFLSGDSIVYSDANGVATTSYIAGNRESPTDGLTIRACYDSLDFATSCTANTETTSATVVESPLSVTIGTDDKVVIEDLTYIARFVVQVVDSAGRAKSGVDVVPSVDLPTFYKGWYVRAAGKWVFATGTPVACVNEDVNRNGVLETGEDLDLDVSLEPRKSDVAISIEGSSKTDSDGQVTLKIEYPQNIASWVLARILVSASGISGTEGRAFWTEVLRVPADAINADTRPAFQSSPYGVVTSVADDPTDNPDRGLVQPCDNKN